MEKNRILSLGVALCMTMLHAFTASPQDLRNQAVLHDAGLSAGETEDGCPEHRMTLKECMEYAVSNSTKMRIQEADRGDERIARRDAILAAFTPSVSAGANAYNYYGRNVDPETNTYVNTTSFNNGYSVSAGFTLFNGFSAVNNLRITKTAMKMGLSQEQQTRDEICLATMEAYYNVVYYNELLDVLEQQVEVARTSLHKAERQEELGQKGRAEVVQMKADLAEREYQAVNTKNLLADAYLTLKDVMFWPLDEELEIDSSVSEYGIVLSHDDRTTEQIADYAKEEMPSAIMAKGTMDNARLELRTAKWKFAPSIGLSAGWSTSYFTYPGQKGYVGTPFKDQFVNNSGEYIQVTLSIPIFDRLARYSDVARKKNAYKRAVAQYDQKMKDIENEVYRAVQDRNSAEAAFFQADKSAQVQEEAYMLSMRQYEQGLISGIEFRTASGKYLESKADRLNSLLKYYIKSSVVEYYNGTPYIEQ